MFHQSKYPNMKKLFTLFSGLLIMYTLSSQNSNFSSIPSEYRNIEEKRPINLSVDESLNLKKALNNYVYSAKSKALNEEIIGNTKYDLQTNYSSQRRIHRFADGTIAGVFTYGEGSPNFPERGTGYNYFDGTNWDPIPLGKIESVRAGWPSIAPYGTNGEIIASHQFTIDLRILSRTPKGSGLWTESIHTGPGGIGLSWPSLITSGDNNDTMHLLALTLPDASGGIPYQGIDGALLYSRSVDGGLSWDIDTLILPGMDSNSVTTFSADCYAWAEPKGDTIAFVTGDNWTDLILMKSNDAGATWNKTVVFAHPYPLFKEDVTLIVDTPWVCDGSLAIDIDNNGMAHIAFGLMRVNNDVVGDDQTSFWPITDGLAYWNENMQPFTNLHVDSVDARGNLVGWMLDIDNSGDLGWLATYEVPKYYMSTTSMPFMHIDNNNDIYLVFSSVHELLNNGTQMYRHLWARKSINLGTSWS